VPSNHCLQPTGANPAVGLVRKSESYAGVRRCLQLKRLLQVATTINRDSAMRFSTALFAIALSLTAVSPAVAQESASTDSAAVTGAVTAFHSALVEGDSAAALRLLAPDLRVLESGHIEDLAQYRSRHLAADIAFAQAVPSQRTIHAVTVIDSVAWLSATSRTTGTYRDRAIDSEGVELMVLTRTPEGWHIRAIHWSSRSRRRE